MLAKPYIENLERLSLYVYRSTTTKSKFLLCVLTFTSFWGMARGRRGGVSAAGSRLHRVS